MPGLNILSILSFCCLASAVPDLHSIYDGDSLNYIDPGGIDLHQSLAEDRFPFRLLHLRNKRETEDDEKKTTDDSVTKRYDRKSYDQIGKTISLLTNKLECLQDVRDKWEIKNFFPETHPQENHQKYIAVNSSSKAPKYIRLHYKATVTLPQACLWQCYAAKNKMVNGLGELSWSAIDTVFRPTGMSQVMEQSKRVFEVCQKIIDDNPDYPFNIHFDTAHGIRDGYTEKACIQTFKLSQCTSRMGSTFIRL